MAKRTDRLNSLLKEVLADVIAKEVRNPNVHALITVTRVDITRDLRHAKVFVSVLGDEDERQQTIQALQSAAGFIAVTASRQVVIRYFPELQFRLDDSVDQHMRIEKVLGEIQEERQTREQEKTEPSS